MIDYDPYHWTSHLLDIEGSMIREIIGRVALCAAFSAGVVVLHHHVHTMEFASTTHTLVGFAIGMLLVFRTNASYDRYWEGRRMWGSIINESRNLARGLRAHVHPRAPELARRAGLWVVAFAFASMNRLRGGTGIGPVLDLLPAEEATAAVASRHPPLAVATRITECLIAARDQGVIPDLVLTHLDQNPQQLIDYLGACERIHKTPLPFVYVVHLRRALFLYCYTLPFALVGAYGWWTVLVTFLVAYTFFGIEEIGVEIENPFGLDSNDLPLSRFCEVIEGDVLGMFDMARVTDRDGPDTIITHARPPLTAGFLPAASNTSGTPVSPPKS